MVNKGRVFLDLVERPETDELAGFLLGRHFIISSITGGMFHGPTTAPQPLHRDQGYVPAMATFPAACNLFWLLDDFTPASGSTHAVPGSHRWPPRVPDQGPAEGDVGPGRGAGGQRVRLGGPRLARPRRQHQRRAPAQHHQLLLPAVDAPAGELGRSCLQEVLDEASPKLRARLGLRSYGTLGGVNGTRTGAEAGGFGNADVVFPEYVIGEGGSLHPLKRVSRADAETGAPGKP